MAFDTFPDHDLLPATTSHVVLSAEVARLRQVLRQAEKVTSEDHDDFWSQESDHYYAQLQPLYDRAVTAERERDAARQALRNLVDATSWYGDKQSGHIQVNEEAMNVAMGLVVAWSREQS